MARRKKTSDENLSPEERRLELEGRLAEKRRQLMYSCLFLALFGISTLYNLKFRLLPLAAILAILFGVEILRFNNIRKASILMQKELDLLKMVTQTP